MRLPTSYKPPLAHRANPVLPSPRNQLLSSIEQPKPRAAISSLLSLPHGVNGASTTAIGRPTFSSARSTDDTVRSVVSQPPGRGDGGGGDPEAARVSLWAEMKDIRGRSRTPGAAGMAKEPSSA
jgi:hypothetical protein